MAEPEGRNGRPTERPASIVKGPNYMESDPFYVVYKPSKLSLDH